MNTDIILTLISSAIAGEFLLIDIIKNKKIPQSISATIYDLPKAQKWVWTIWMWFISLTACIPMMDKIPAPLGFATMASLMFCGALPLQKKQSQTMHNIFGISSGILSQICVAIMNPACLAVWALMPIALIKKLKNNAVFIAELICAVSLYCSQLL